MNPRLLDLVPSTKISHKTDSPKSGVRRLKSVRSPLPETTTEKSLPATNSTLADEYLAFLLSPSNRTNLLDWRAEIEMEEIEEEDRQIAMSKSFKTHQPQKSQPAAKENHLIANVIDYIVQFGAGLTSIFSNSEISAVQATLFGNRIKHQRVARELLETQSRNARTAPGAR